MLTKLAKSSGLGYRVRPDFRKKKLYFEVYKGTDHTVLQLENPHVIFSKPYENLNDVTYTYDDKKYGTVFYVGGEGEGEQRKIVRLALGEENGTELREVFIDAKDVRQEELSDSEYEEVLLERGREKAADYVKIESIEAEVEDANFIYKKDWDIGDLVTVRKKEWGITLNESAGLFYSDRERKPGRESSSTGAYKKREHIRVETCRRNRSKGSGSSHAGKRKRYKSRRQSMRLGNREHRNNRRNAATSTAQYSF